MMNNDLSFKLKILREKIHEGGGYLFLQGEEGRVVCFRKKTKTKKTNKKNNIIAQYGGTGSWDLWCIYLDK